jgi:hypothetical protein
LAGERWLYFKGSGGEGGLEEWAPRGGGMGKRERGRGLGAAWSSAMVWLRRGSGPVEARAGGALPRDNGERRGRCNTDGVANRWAET